MPTAAQTYVLPILLHQEPKTQGAAPTERGAPQGAVTQVPGDTAPKGPGPGAAEQGCGYTQLAMMGLFIALMWFMVLRPEGKRRKETAQMLSALKAGDRVVTIGGMHGIVDRIEERTVLLKCGDQRLVFDRTAITRVVRDEVAADANKKA